MRAFRLGLAVFVGAHAIPGAQAHLVGLSTAQGQFFGDTFALTIGFAPGDAQQLLPEEHRPKGPWTPDGFQSARGLLLWLAPQLWQVHVDGKPLSPREVRVNLLPGDTVSFQLLFHRPREGRKIILRALKLSELPASHRELIVIENQSGSQRVQKLLTAQDDTLELELSAEGAIATKAKDETSGSTGGPQTFGGFLKLGVEHIWTGYDHLLFLFGLLVVCRTFRSTVAIISCFTLAHSLTLALATLDYVNLPSRFTEPAIAASIVIVGVENLVRRGAEPRGRWALSFAFGLIHGFGFATVLRDLGVGAGGKGLTMPLFAFNLGVEIGQIAIASLVLPIIWRLRRNEAFDRRAVPALSAIVTVAGIFWFLERTVFA